MRAEPEAPAARSPPAAGRGASSPYRIASSMSWLMYATRRRAARSSPRASPAPLARVREDPVADLGVRLSPSRDPERLLVVAEPQAEALAQRFVERVLPGVAERGVPDVVPEPDRLGQVLVQPERAGDDARDRRRLQRVRHPGAVVVALRVDEDLRLPLQPAERLRVDDPVPVALERRPHRARFLVALPPAGLVRPHRERREPAVLLLADARLERVTDSSGQLRHHIQRSHWSGPVHRIEEGPRSTRPLLASPAGQSGRPI